jgi:TonB family protein
MGVTSLVLMAWILDSAAFAGDWLPVEDSSPGTAYKASGDEKRRGVEGCATENGCQPFFEVRIPPGTDPTKFSPRLLVRLTISSKGSVKRAILKKSTGSPEVDEQVLKGIREWRFKEGKSARELSIAVLIHLR